MNTLALTLNDFRARLTFSNQIEDAQIRPYIKDAYALDLVPLFGYGTLEAVDALTAATVAPFAEGLEAGAYVQRRERIYLLAADALPLPEPPADGISAAPWQYEPLQTLWLLYLKEWWIYAAYQRFLAQHGSDVTKAGITQPNDPNATFVRASSADKAALQAAVDSRAEAHKSRLLRFMQGEQQLYSAGKGGYEYYPTTHCGTTSNRQHRRRFRGV